MHKVMKEIKNKKFLYKLGYNLHYGKVYPSLEIFNNGKWLSIGGWGYGNNGRLFGCFANKYSFAPNGIISSFGTIKEMFTWLRQYSDIPEYIEKEFENIFLLYKRNDFKELRED